MRTVKVTIIRHPNWEILLKSNMKLNSRCFFFHLNISRRIQGEGTTSVNNFVLLPSSCSTQTWKTAIRQTHQRGICGDVSCLDSTCPCSFCTLSPCTLLSSLLAACSREPYWAFTHPTLLLSSTLAGKEAATAGSRGISSLRGRETHHRAAPTWPL